MPARRTRLAQLTVALCGLVLVLCSACTTTGSSSNANGLTSGGINLVPAADRKAAPDLSGDLLGGGRASLRSHAGQVVVLNIWGSWCAPCRKEAPELVKAATMLPKAAFLGIDIRDNEGDAEAFVARYSVPYPSFFDQDSSLLLGFRGIVPVTGQPITLVLDKEHRVAASIYGTTTAITLKDIVQPLERQT
jgi:thiol-disulfide isomerase/thioredoxin